MFEILLCSYFGLDHTSFEIIHTGIDDHQFVWYYFKVRSQVLQRMMHTKFLSKFQIISKLPAVRNCTYLLELRGTKFSFVPIMECHVWNELKDFVILIVIFSIMVE